MSESAPSSVPDWYRPPKPYEPGNLAHLKHGADSARVIEARAVRVRDEILEVAPWLDHPEYAPAVARFLRAEARALLIHENIVKISSERGADKVPVRQWEQATAADRLAAQLGQTLGLDPIGRARLQQAAAGAELTTATLADVLDRGRAARLAAERRPVDAIDAVPVAQDGDGL